MTDQNKIQEAVNRNYEAFLTKLPELLKTHNGKYALLRDREVVQMFDSTNDALIYAEKEFPDGLYSIQLVADSVADLGYFSHAVH